MNNFRSLCVLIVICILSLCQDGKAGILSYRKTKLEEDGSVVSRVGMFAPGDVPSNSSPGKGRSYIELDVALARESTNTSGSISVLVFHSRDKGRLGSRSGNKLIGLCCTPEMYSSGQCRLGDTNFTVGQVIAEQKATNRYWPYTKSFGKGDAELMLKERHPITVSGIYYVYYINCPYSNAGDAVIRGKATFLNPYGYLNGEMFYFMPFYGILSLVYLFLGIVWLVLSAKHWRQLLKLQNCIAGVIALGMIETATWYFDNLGYNNSGQNYVGAMIVGVIVSAIKRTFSRLLVLIVSMGFGVVRPTLGTAQHKVILLGVLYFIFSGTLTIIELVQRTVVVSVASVLLLVFPVAALDTVFYWWIFLSLLRTISQLEIRKQPLKLRMYKRFFATLVISGVVSGLMILIQLFVAVSTDVDETWKSQWIWTAFWHVLYFVILLAIAVLWRPTTNNTRYSYSEMSADDSDDSVITLQPLNIAGSDVTLRKKEEEGISGDSALPSDDSKDKESKFSLEETDITKLE